ncbi:MAG: acyl-CoA thioesterase [Flavobacteriales bacterium]|nr:acyl-CoA thioesterase [Flavobacteriales bacterium]
MTPFEIEIIVSHSAIDDLNHVNNVTYLQWVQDAAEQHWNAKTDSRLRETYAWVVVNHNITYKNPAFESETLLLQTWVENYTNVTCERHTKIVRKRDGVLLVTAKTVWCLIDKNTQKPSKITDELLNLFP